MTAAFSNLSLTLTQNAQQRLLRVVDVSYSYTLTNRTTQTPTDPNTPFQVEIDILGDDVLTDDLLARAVDSHSIECPPGAKVTNSRSITVAQGLLDEDMGDDEIKLTIRVQRGTKGSTEPAVEATTPVVKGKF